MDHTEKPFASIWPAALLAAVVVGAASSAVAQSARGATRVAIVTDGPSPAVRRFVGLIRRETADLGGRDVSVLEARPAWEGDWTRAGASRVLEAALVDPGVDVVVAVGLLSGEAAVRHASLPRPVIVPLTLGQVLSALPREGGASGRRNLAYLDGGYDVGRDLGVLATLVRVRHVALLVDGEIAGDPAAAERIATSVRESSSVRATVVAAEPAGGAPVPALPADVDAVYVLSALRASDDEVRRMLAALRDRRVATMSAQGTTWVASGALATTVTEDVWTRRARRIALLVRRAGEGADVSREAASFDASGELVVNAATLRAIGGAVPFDALGETRVVDSGAERGQRLSLRGAVAEALRRNLDLRAARLGELAGEEDVSRARARLMPRLEARLGTQWIDSEHASPLGSAERSATATLSSTSTIYSESVWTDIGVQQQMQRSRTHEVESTRLDLAHDTAEAYVGLLRARSSERVLRESLARSQRHLAMARARESAGGGRRADVHRWTIEVAEDQRAVLNAVADRSRAEIRLNGLLVRPAESPLAPAEASPRDAALLGTHPRFSRLLDDPSTHEALARELVREGLAASPELRRIEAFVAARERALEGHRRSLWVPTISARAEAQLPILRSGEGSDAGNLPPELASQIPDGDAISWRVGLEASFSIFEGGATLASIRQTRRDAERARVERAAVASRIEQQIRSHLHRVVASRAGVRLAQRAAAAAADNLAIVSDAYAAGASDVVTLVDAQTQARTTELAALDAWHSLLVDLVHLERSIGRAVVVGPRSDRDRLARRLGRIQRLAR